MENLQYIYLGTGALIVGYLGYWIVFTLLKTRLQSEGKGQAAEILEDAKRQAERTKKSEVERIEVTLQAQQEELEEDLHERTEALKLADEELNARHSSTQREESRVQKLETDLKTREEKLAEHKAEYKKVMDEVANAKRDVVVKLGQVAGVSPEDTSRTICESIVDERKLQSQKLLKFLEEELNSNSKRNATRMMSRAMARYAPEFYWPKSVNFVEMPLGTKEKLEATSVLQDLKEIGGIDIEIPESDNPDYPPIIKLAGGAGVDREAVRQTLIEAIPRGPGAWAKIKPVYDRQRELLEQEAIKLGRKAIHELRLQRIHPEIQKLVGYLNWRTSYRQNQWYHTVEVAKLAGIIAHELGVDPDAAKRVGLLHDIGKAIDYRIEGSHAVISGDYADRFGERRLICDTVMSHHNDLIIETPLAFVLKAADTLSGARPGARVNLEEGYQMRLSGIDAAVRSFAGVVSVSIMNGAREVHVEVNHKRVKDSELERLTADMAKKVSEDVAFPGEIKILVSRRFEATSVA